MTKESPYGFDADPLFIEFYRPVMSCGVRVEMWDLDGDGRLLGDPSDMVQGYGSPLAVVEHEFTGTVVSSIVHHTSIEFLGNYH